MPKYNAEVILEGWLAKLFRTKRLWKPIKEEETIETNLTNISDDQYNCPQDESRDDYEYIPIYECISGKLPITNDTNVQVVPPPRPPKYLTTSSCYLNLTSLTSQLNHENNDKQIINIPIFKYYLKSEQLEPSHAHSPSPFYSNLPSPLLPEIVPPWLPPAVNRQLKPRPKISETDHLVMPRSSGALEFFGIAPPVNRNLKPLQKLHMCNSFIDKYDAATIQKVLPSPILPNYIASEDIYQYESEICHHGSKHMQYLDLDLKNSSSNKINRSVVLPKPIQTNTVYKKIDFEQTEGFRITRNNLEKERRKLVVAFGKN